MLDIITFGNDVTITIGNHDMITTTINENERSNAK